MFSGCQLIKSLHVWQCYSTQTRRRKGATQRHEANAGWCADNRSAGLGEHMWQSRGLRSNIPLRWTSSWNRELWRLGDTLTLSLTDSSLIPRKSICSYRQRAYGIVSHFGTSCASKIVTDIFLLYFIFSSANQVHHKLHVYPTEKNETIKFHSAEQCLQRSRVASRGGSATRRMWRGHMLRQSLAQNEQRWNINAL